VYASRESGAQIEGLDLKYKEWKFNTIFTTKLYKVINKNKPSITNYLCSITWLFTPKNPTVKKTLI
jgi:hypothetical protein